MVTSSLLYCARTLPNPLLPALTKSNRFVPFSIFTTRPFASASRTASIAQTQVHTTPFPLRKRPVRLNPDLIVDHAIISYKGNKDIKPTYFSSLIPNDLPNLSNMNLSGVDIDSKDLNSIFGAAPNLVYLNFDWNTIIKPGDIAEKLSTAAKNLKYLKCMQTKLNSVDIKQLFSLSPNLEKASLHCLENIKPHEFKRLNLAHATIQELSLFGTRVALDDVKQILGHFPKLKKLGLTRCPHIDSHDIIELKECYPHIQFV
ncbi:MAG: hypothetical protein KBE16_00275 [Alphaproteobacteria bacterium]|jgi:hypothetical protein|nr:hypothetical protein [Alphaproteobacteria bacterium]MBP9876907.1 hypothetical protein [Alphaproteobacteria bacterium]